MLSFGLQHLRVLSGALGHSPRNMVAVLCSFCLPQRHLGHCAAAPGSFRVKGSSHCWSLPQVDVSVIKSAMCFFSVAGKTRQQPFQKGKL